MTTPRTPRFRPLIVTSTLCVAIACSVSVDDSTDVRASVARAPDTQVYSGTLTGPSDEDPADVITAFVASNGGHVSTVRSLTVAAEYALPGSNLGQVRMEQIVEGLPVVGAYVKATFDDQGRMVHLMQNLAPVPEEGIVPAGLDEAQALDAGVGHHYPSQAAADLHRLTLATADRFFYRPPTVERVAIAMDDGSMHEGFLVETWTQADNMLMHTLVDGDGEVLDVQVRTNADSYNVFPIDPGRGEQTLVTGPGAGNVESPAGWLNAGSHSTVDIGGNNVHAYLDVNADNAPDAGGTAVSDGNFGAIADLAAEPEAGANQDVAVQNLFYFNNLIHDTLYRHGFTESVGNFQNDNFGNGGAGGDAVNAEAQDGSGTDNANFSTPSDGSPGRMQMYVWTQTTPKRDGDLDSDIIWHEYGHGLTWRMIGNMSGPMSGAIGEGMSDVLSFLANDDDVVGEYSYNNLLGIRSEPYDGYSRTYGDFDGGSVHFDGEIYAATIWKAKVAYEEAGIQESVLYDDLIGGMNFTPSGPSMEDMRDGILAQADGARHCLIWEAFADSGIGVGAKGSIKGGGPFGGGKVSVTESFELPVECQAPAVCGDGTVEGTEACDDGNTVGDDGCAADCTLECGNGALDGAEECDDGNTEDNDGCSSSCTIETSYCGDGTVDAGEECDDGNNAAGDGCAADCTVENACLPLAASCTSNSDCCSGKCKGGPNNKTCK